MRAYSKQSYRELVQLAREQGYEFAGFSEPTKADCRTIYLRHDVDYFLSMTVELAQINASLCVGGTFFVLLRSQIYNLLSNWTFSQMKEISALGQRLAFQ